MLDESFKQIEGLDSYYVSKDGVVVSVVKGTPKKLKPHKHRNGHLRIKVKRKNFPVHRLVIETWVGPAPSPKHVVRHLNDVHGDNRHTNLCWGTIKENSADAKCNASKKNKIIMKMLTNGFTTEEVSIVTKIPVLELNERFPKFKQSKASK